jgi:hypothetical protein
MWNVLCFPIKSHKNESLLCKTYVLFHYTKCSDWQNYGLNDYCTPLGKYFKDGGGRLLCQDVLRFWCNRKLITVVTRIRLLHGAESLLRSWPVFAASQEIPRILWNPKVLYRTHKCPPHVLILSQLHPVPTTPSSFLKIRLNIILLSMSGSPQLSLSLRFPYKHPVHPSLLPHMCHMPRPSHY